MGQKDITEKLLEDYNDVFADIINGLIFKGEQRILPESLENAKVHSQYKAEDGKVHELERDVIKYWKEKKVELAICGIENQSNVKNICRSALSDMMVLHIAASYWRAEKRSCRS